MKKTLLLLGFSLLSLTQLNAQKKTWTKVDVTKGITAHKNTTRESFPKQFVLYTVDFQAIKQTLLTAEDRFQPNAKSAIIELPTSEGKLEKFKMYEASNFDSELQAQFPEIRAYAGNGITNPSKTVRLSISPLGIQTMIMNADKANDYMEVFSEDGSIYAVYNKSATTPVRNFRCSTPDEQLELDLTELGKNNQGRFNDIKYRTFRLAQSCTAEYSNYFGATSSAQVALVLAAFNNTYARVNGVFERDFAIHMNIVSQSQNVIYYNAATDPYSAAAAGAGGAWNTELQNTLSSSLTGPATSLAANNAAYDIGHLFGASGGGGNAGCIGCICTNDTASTTDKNKGSGFTSPGDAIPSGDNFDIDYVAHEIGHQLGGNHSFTHSGEDNPVNYEVGSGVTVMGYAGITNYDVAPHSIDTFHAGSIEQIQTNILTKTCDVETSITHSAPVANAGADYTIPISTPFMLTGTATDAGGGSLTYQWEQYDQVDGTTYMTTGSPAAVGKAGGPNFRSYVPSASGVRYFPTMATVMQNSATTLGADIAVEALSNIARTLNFRLTVRDNVAGQGQTNFDNSLITVTAAAGPLTVTSQNADGISYPVNSTQTVTWAVNNTNTLSGGANVDILLTTDAGATWTTLLTNTPNDGSQAVTLPVGVGAPFCRFMVKANGNIFFNVNSKDFAIGYTVTTTCNTYSNNTVLAVPDGTGANTPGAVVSKTISVPTSETISDVNVTLGIVNHSYIEDLVVAMNHPDNTQVTLWNRNCDNNPTSLTYVFSDGNPVVPATGCTATTGTFSASSSLATLNGKPSNGTWTLLAADYYNGDTGSIGNWSIEICSQQALNNSSFVNEISDLAIYPNPNNGTFTINFQSISNSTEIKIHDIRGRRVFEKTYENNGIFNQNISLNSAESGVYLVTIQDGNRNITKKIVIE